MKERLREQQSELEATEQLIQGLHKEYRTVSAQNGRAHAAAVFVNSQEQEWQQTRDRLTTVAQSRAERVLQVETANHLKKIQKQKSDKDAILLKRRELFKTDWAERDALNNKKTAEQRMYEEQLKKLIELEKELEKKLQDSKREPKGRVRADDEAKLEYELAKMYYPERMKPNWLLDDDSSTLSNIPHDLTLANDTRDSGLGAAGAPRASKAKQTRFETRQTRPNDRLNVPARNVGETFAKLLLEHDKKLANPELPHQIAEKVMKRLDEIKKAREAGHTVVYKDAAINTSALPSASRTNGRTGGRLDASVDSGETSYRRLPSDIQPEKLKRAFQRVEEKAGELGLPGSEAESSSMNNTLQLQQLQRKIEALRHGIEEQLRPGNLQTAVKRIEQEVAALSDGESDTSSGSNTSELMLLQRKIEAVRRGLEDERRRSAGAAAKSTTEADKSRSSSKAVDLVSPGSKSKRNTSVSSLTTELSFQSGLTGLTNVPTRDPKRFWTDVYTMAGLAMPTSAERAVERAARQALRPPMITTPEASLLTVHSTPTTETSATSAGGSGDTVVATPAQRGLSEEPNLTFVGSFDTDTEKSG